ncbi:unnamed protein product [Jaminaea pallidilutea]
MWPTYSNFYAAGASQQPSSSASPSPRRPITASGASRPASARPQPDAKVAESAPQSQPKPQYRSRPQGQATSVQEEGRLRGGSSKGLWESWKSLPPRTRMTFAFGTGAFAVIGIILSDRLEGAFPADEPPFWKIRLVDSEESKKQ